MNSRIEATMRILFWATVVLLMLCPIQLAAQATSKPSFAMSDTGLLFARSINSEDLNVILQSGRKLLVFDTREKDEFEVSHIPGAMRLDPAVETQVIVGRVRRRAKGAILVFYCTSTERSARIAEWAAEDLKALGAEAVYVLKMGIVGWANTELPLVNREGNIKFIHPYNRTMMRYLKRPEFARFHVRKR